MARSPQRPPRPPPRPRTPQPMAAPAAATPACHEEDEERDFVICEDSGFIYKRPRGLYPDAAPSSTQAAPPAGPDPETARLRRRRRALLRLRDKRLGELSRWEALASLPAPRPPASEAPPASPHPVASTATASASALDDLLAQAEVQAELLKKASQWCDEINYLCDAHDESIFDSIVSLPLWGEPVGIMASFCRPDESTDHGLDSQRSKRAIERASNYGHKEVAVQMTKNSGEKGKLGPCKCKKSFQFGHTEKTCETPAEIGDDHPPPILTENRKRKGACSPSVGAQTTNTPKSKKASGSRSTPSSTPRSTTRRKAPSIPTRTPETFVSPGPVTRRKAAAV